MTYENWNRNDKTQRILRHIYAINLVLVFFAWFCLEGVSSLILNILFYYVLGWSNEFDYWGFFTGMMQLMFACGVGCMIYFWKYAGWRVPQLLALVIRTFGFRVGCSLFMSFGEFAQIELFAKFCVVGMTVMYILHIDTSPFFFPTGYYGGEHGKRF